MQHPIPAGWRGARPLARICVSQSLPIRRIRPFVLCSAERVGQRRIPGFLDPRSLSAPDLPEQTDSTLDSIVRHHHRPHPCLPVSRSNTSARPEKCVSQKHIYYISCVLGEDGFEHGTGGEGGEAEWYTDAREEMTDGAGAVPGPLASAERRIVRATVLGQLPREVVEGEGEEGDGAAAAEMRRQLAVLYATRPTAASYRPAPGSCAAVEVPRLSVAPMMDWTDRHYRHLARVCCRRHSGPFLRRCPPAPHPPRPQGHTIPGATVPRSICSPPHRRPDASWLCGCCLPAVVWYRQLCGCAVLVAARPPTGHIDDGASFPTRPCAHKLTAAPGAGLVRCGVAADVEADPSLH